jgi:hypothetical protein
MTYIHKSATDSSGFKAWKNRLTLVLSGNEAGYMIKPEFVYHAKNSRTLKNRTKLSALLLATLPQVMGHGSFVQWMLPLTFIPEVKEYLEKEGLPLKCYR